MPFERQSGEVVHLLGHPVEATWLHRTRRI
jgi:hypothetical protein